MKRLTASLLALLFGVSAWAADAPVGVKVPANQRFVLPSGLTLVLVPKKDVPLIAFSGFVRGGSLADPADKPGVGSLVAGLLARGAGTRNAFQFADAQEAALRAAFTRSGADTLELATDDDLLDALLRFADLLKQRARLKSPLRFPAHLKDRAEVPA